MLPAPQLSGARLAPWIVVLAALIVPLFGHSALAQGPSADFTVTPATPTAGAAATFRAVLSQHYEKASVWWHFGVGPLGPIKRGREVRHTFGAAGDKQVTMAVVRGGDVKAMVTRTVRVLAAAPGPAPEPEPEPEPSPGPQPPPSQGPSDDDGDDDDEPVFDIPQNPPPPESGSQLPNNGAVPAPALMSPFPIVRIAGLLLAEGARVRVLSVRAPRGAVVSVHCRGEGCPLRSVRQRVRRRVLRVQRLERLLNAGVRLEIYVRQRNRVGKYTRIRIQAGRRPPLRVDRCVRPGRLTPIRCPFS
jgi:hypothetical protein